MDAGWDSVEITLARIIHDAGGPDGFASGSRSDKRLTFNIAPRNFSDQPVVASPENRKKAIEFLKGLDARGGTDIIPALDRAFAMQVPDARNVPADDRPQSRPFRLRTSRGRQRGHLVAIRSRRDHERPTLAAADRKPRALEPRAFLARCRGVFGHWVDLRTIPGAIVSLAASRRGNDGRTFGVVASARCEALPRSFGCGQRSVRRGIVPRSCIGS